MAGGWDGFAYSNWHAMTCIHTYGQRDVRVSWIYCLALVYVGLICSM